ncbi:MAG: hypothetical protein AAF244_04810 [Pseudomonadota bacterium]
MTFFKLKFSFILCVVFLCSCALLPQDQAHIISLDIPEFKNTQTVQLNVSDIIVINKYASDRYVGEYGDNFALHPYKIFEEYLLTRFKPTGDGDPLYITINKASLLNIPELNTSRRDELYVFDFDVTAGFNNNLPVSENIIHVQTVRNFRQVLDLLTRKQERDGQIVFLQEVISDFDREFVAKLQSKRLVSRSLTP